MKAYMHPSTSSKTYQENKKMQKKIDQADLKIQDIEKTESTLKRALNKTSITGKKNLNALIMNAQYVKQARDKECVGKKD